MTWRVTGCLMLPVRRIKLPQLRLSIRQVAWLRRLAGPVEVTVDLAVGHRIVASILASA